MPNKKNCKKYEKLYTEDQVQQALVAIKNGMSKKLASKSFGVPSSTLQFRLSDKFSKICYGPQTYLTSNEENLLVQWIIDSHRKGFLGGRRMFKVL